MMRDIEKVFEILKDEFNRKVSTNFFDSYSERNNDVFEDLSSSESFEDISMHTELRDESPYLAADSDHDQPHLLEPYLNLDSSKNGKPFNDNNLDGPEYTSYYNSQKGTHRTTDFTQETVNNDFVVPNNEENIETHILNEIFDRGNEENKIKVQNYKKNNECDNKYKRKSFSITKTYETLENDSSKTEDKDVSKYVNAEEDRQKTQKTQCYLSIMWSETLEVIESGILKELSNAQIQLQEAMFEIITSEASFYRHLMILTTHFFDSDLFKKDNLVSSIERHHIFSNIILIMSTSQKFLKDLENRWNNEKPQLSQICDIILKHANGNDFQNYVTYLRNQEYQNKALKQLGDNELFKQRLQKLENSPICGKLPIDSYLVLPMQRLTRLKLLVNSLLKVMKHEELKYIIEEEHVMNAKLALDKLKQLLDDSDFQKGFMDQKTTLMLLMNKMDFPPHFKRVIISNKTFIKEVELIVHHENLIKNIRKFSTKRQPIISFILFNDLLILAKKKSSRLFVIDYCDRNFIEVASTKYQSLQFSQDIPSLSSFNKDTEEGDILFPNTLSRSKTSLTADDLRRLSLTITNSLKSMPLINRNNDPNFVANSFTIKFIKGQTDIFITPMVFITKDRLERDEWMNLLDGRTTESKVNNFSKMNTHLQRSSLINDTLTEDSGIHYPVRKL